MRLVFSTEDFVFGGRARPSFPLLLTCEMQPAEPFHCYLLHRLLEQGKLLELATWESYGRRLWDFAQFLCANHLAWNQPFESIGQSVVHMYRDWQAYDLRLSPTTINDRLEIVTDMYGWALSRRLIERLPFSYSDKTVRGIEHDLAHVTGGRQTIARPDMLMAEWVEEPAFLTAEQVRTARDAIRSTSLRLLFDLMVRVGLRSCEARTFPVAYVFDPSTRVDLRPGTLIDVRLNPKEMKIKFNKPRVVHVPYSLMEEMYAYSELERNARLDPRNPRRELILTTCSNPYSRQSLVKVISSISKEVRFPISPLMLRHSYAIHTLLFLRAHPEIQIEPLMYVRDRLGHSSVQTTMTYLRQIERLLGAEALAMMNEFDSLYRIGDGLASVAPQGRKSRENWKVSDGSS